MSGYIRGQERMVLQTTIDYLVTQLTALDWIGTSGWPFGATVGVTIQDDLPPVDTAAAPNTVAITDGTVHDDEEGELGAGLFLTDHVIFIDVFGESIGIAKAIASDIRAILTGKLTDTNRYQVLVDYSSSPAVATDALIEYQTIEMERPLNQAFQANWMALHVTAQLQWIGSE